MRRGHGHRPVPELGPDDPRRSDREGRDVNVDDVPVQMYSSQRKARCARRTEKTYRFELFFCLLTLCRGLRTLHIIYCFGFCCYLVPFPYLVSRAPLFLLSQKLVLSALLKYQGILR